MPPFLEKSGKGEDVLIQIGFMSTRFDGFSGAECHILDGALAVYRDSYYAGLHPALWAELMGATNYPGKTVDSSGGNRHPGRQ